MKVAVFGGSGFLGYDFVRLALRDGGCVPVVYSSSAKSLSNVARHEVDIRLYPSSDPESVVLDADVDTVINFSHPFERRDGISGYTQVERFARFVGRARERNPRLRLIHTSSMSVYEPFAPGRQFAENTVLSAPRADRYAREKIAAERALARLPQAQDWQLLVRPTVVYGPFCGVWTDRIFEAFLAGDVGYRDLAGRIQPLNGADLSRFILHRLRDFRAGFYNIAGPHSMSWLDFFEAFREIANHGALRRLDDRGLVAEGKEGLLSFYSSNLRELMHAVRREPAFDRMAVSIARHLPERAVQSIRGLLLGRGEAAAPKVDARYPAEYLRRFFGEDRLVSSARATADFPDFVARPLAAFGDQLRAYFRFRFHDDDFI